VTPTSTHHRPTTLDLIRRVSEKRFSDQPSWVILIEMFIGLGWIRAATEKVIDRSWWSGDVIEIFVAQHNSLTLRWYEPLLEHLLLPNVTTLTVVIVAGQLLAGTALLTGRYMAIGLTLGFTMNINFIMIGAVDPSIFYLMLQAVLALWLFEVRVTPGLAIRSLGLILISAAFVGLISVPFVRTIDPAHVVEDPATILTTYSLSIAIAAIIARRRLIEKRIAR